MRWKKRLRAWLCLTAALVLAAGIALGEVYIEQEKPADWEERDLLRIYALYSLDCDAYILQCGGQTIQRAGKCLYSDRNLLLWSSGPRPGKKAGKTG